MDIYEKYNIKSTFFFTGYIAKLYPAIVKMILPYGHEVGSHALSHNIEDSLDKMDLQNQIKHLSESKKILEDLSGNEVISFRSPALRVNKYTPAALVETGYKIDSSVASTRFDAFFSFGSIQKIKWLSAPRVPYKTRVDTLFKKGTNGVIEIPLSATLFPYIGTTMRIFPRLTKIQHSLLHFETHKLNSKPVVFDIHPNELIDESIQPRIISKRTNNYFSFLVKDFIRSKLKTRNLGIRAIQLYEREIQFYISKNYSFLTLKDYCQKHKQI